MYTFLYYDNKEVDRFNISLADKCSSTDSENIFKTMFGRINILHASVI